MRKGWAKIQDAPTDKREHFFIRANGTGCGMRSVDAAGEKQDAPNGVPCVPCVRAWRSTWPTKGKASA
jgi:hypothetical protein